MNMKQVLRVFSEFETDLNNDIEGCDSEELKDIESQISASKELKRRIVAHINDGADARGAKSW